MKTNLFILFIFTFISVYGTIKNVGLTQSFLTIQSAINNCSEGDTVLVQEGTYNEDINFLGKKITVASLYLIDGNSIHSNYTIIKGTETGSVVKFINGEDSTSILKGFAIMNGNSLEGGGIYCSNASPKLNNLILANNKATMGGGIYLEHSNAKLNNVNTYNNYAINGGGGLAISGGSPIFENSRVSYNSAESMGGGGILIGWNSNPTLKNIDVSYNNIVDSLSWNLAGPGGGILCWTEGNPTLINVNIHDNIAKSGGGLACWYNSKPNFISAIINNNTLKGVSNVSSNGGGGGLEIWNSDVIVKNTLITNNTAKKGGAVVISSSNTKFINVTIADNEATEFGKGGAIYKGFGGSLEITNTIMNNNWAPLNQIPTKVDNIYDCGSQCFADITPEIITISYSQIKDGLSSISTDRTLNYENTNISSDPLFSSNSYSLDASSPCIDMGTPSITTLDLPLYDVIGNPRISNGRIDIGSYEMINTIFTEFETIKDDFYIYPIVNKGVVYIKTDKLQISKIKIFNFMGICIYDSNIISSRIDISNNPKGNYILILETKNKIIRQKFINY